MTPLLELVRSHRAEARCGIYSVCSAHRGLRADRSDLEPSQSRGMVRGNAAVELLQEASLHGTPPMGLLFQYLPSAYDAERSGELPLRMSEIVINQVRRILAQYSRACDAKN